MGLMLTRKRGQAVVLLDEKGELIARVSVGDAEQNKAKLYFEAPKSVVIMREELLKK